MSEKEEKTNKAPKLLGVYNCGARQGIYLMLCKSKTLTNHGTTIFQRNQKTLFVSFVFLIPTPSTCKLKFQTEMFYCMVHHRQFSKLLAGDFTSTGGEGEVQHFTDFIVALPHKHKIIIAGFLH